MHHWLERVLTNGNYKVKDLESDVHGEKLFRGTMAHNCYVLDEMGLIITIE